MSATESLLTDDDLAAETGVPKRTWGQWRYLGKGPAFIHVGRHVRYRRADVEAWYLAQRQGGAA